MRKPLEHDKIAAVLRLVRAITIEEFPAHFNAALDEADLLDPADMLTALLRARPHLPAALQDKVRQCLQSE